MEDLTISDIVAQEYGVKPAVIRQNWIKWLNRSISAAGLGDDIESKEISDDLFEEMLRDYAAKFAAAGPSAKDRRVWSDGWTEKLKRIKNRDTPVIDAELVVDGPTSSALTIARPSYGGITSRIQSLDADMEEMRSNLDCATNPLAALNHVLAQGTKELADLVEAEVKATTYKHLQAAAFRGQQTAVAAIAEDLARKNAEI
jgi:hypothetical protein